jgi:hypothetical protein
MESATLTRPGPGPEWRSRLRLGAGSARSRLPGTTWSRVALAAIVVVAILGYLLLPTFPTYDSYYALLWGRDLLHLHLPDFQVYRSPTEHPLAIAFGVVLSIFGQGAARLMILGAILSFVALVVAIYRIGSICFGPVIGVIAGLLLLSRFDIEYLAAQGYLDVTYMALVAWAVVLELGRKRRGTPVFLVLALAGMLRPDAWLLIAAYWLWCAWPADNRTRLRYVGLSLIAPVVWVGLDFVVTGNPLYSLHSTSGLAEALGRTKGLSSIPGSTWQFMVRLDKLPVVLGGLAGIGVAGLLLPRRTLVPLAVFVLEVAVFALQGAAGASVIDRYLLTPAVFMLVFAAVFLGGWSLLTPGWLRRAWMAAAGALVLYGVIAAASTLNLTGLRNDLASRNDFHAGLVTALRAPSVRAALQRCPVLSLPNNKLIPDARWTLGTTGQHDIIARSQARADAQLGSSTLRARVDRGVAVYPLGSAVFTEAIVDIGDDPLDQVPLSYFHSIFIDHYYAVFAPDAGRC